jgi:cadmium resistance protein CadD (predicted permease)
MAINKQTGQLHLVGILLLTLIGITSKKIAQFSSKNLPFSKLLLSLFFITLGIYLILDRI